MRWPSSHELDLDASLLSNTGPAGDFFHFYSKVERVSEYITKNYDKLRIADFRKKDAGKDFKKAYEWKEKGNKHFANKEWMESIKCYTEVTTPQTFHYFRTQWRTYVTYRPFATLHLHPRLWLSAMPTEVQHCTICADIKRDVMMQHVRSS
jgi:hypothetical protein